MMGMLKEPDAHFGSKIFCATHKTVGARSCFGVYLRRYGEDTGPTWSDVSCDLVYDIPQIRWTALPCLLVGSDMHVVGEGSKTRVVPGIIPTVARFPSWSLPVVTILLPGNLIMASPFYLYILGEEKCRAIDKID
jgi:hypothetical protein